jgi:hypothetical protein
MGQRRLEDAGDAAHHVDQLNAMFESRFESET